MSEFEHLHFENQQDTEQLAYYYDTYEEYTNAAGWCDWMNSYTDDKDNSRGNEPTDAEQLEIDRLMRGYWNKAQSMYVVWYISLKNGKYREQHGVLAKFENYADAHEYYNSRIRITQSNHESSTEGYEIHHQTEVIEESYDDSQDIFSDPSNESEEK